MRQILVQRILMSLKHSPYSWLENLPDKITIYTHQHKDVLKDFDTRGYITGNPNFILPNEEHYESFDRPYKWMVEQMAKRIPNFSGEYPVWAWVKRPDTRIKHIKHHLDDVLISAQVDRKRILLSCFDLWHSALNNSGIFLTEDEWISKDDTQCRDEKEKSWELMFDMSEKTALLAKNWWSYRKCVQACIDRVYKDEIINIRTYR